MFINRSKILILMVAMAVFFSIWIGTNIQAKQVTIDYLIPEGHVEAANRVLSEMFMQKYPNIKITVVAAPFELTHEKLAVEFAHHLGKIDVVMVPSLYMQEFAYAGWLAPLNKYISDSDLEALYKKVVKVEIPKPVSMMDLYCVFTLPGAVEKRVYSMPYQNDVYVLFYRKDLFEKYGIEVPTNKEQYMEAAKKLTLDINGDGKIEIYGTTLCSHKIGEDLAEDFISILRAFGSGWFENRYSMLNPGKPIINNEGGIKALEYYKKLLDYAPPGATDTGIFEAAVLMQQGKVAMIRDWHVFGTMMEDREKSKVFGRVGYAKEPFPIPLLAGWELVISYDSPYKDEAWKFIQFISSDDPEVQDIFQKNGGDSYYVSSIINPEFQKRDPVYRVIIDSWRCGWPQGIWPENEELQEIVTNYGSAYLVGAITSAKEAVDRMASEFERLLYRAGYPKK